MKTNEKNHEKNHEKNSQVPELVYEKGMIVEVELDNGIGSEQYGKRPCVIIQNNVGNRFSPTLIVAICTTKQKTNLPTQVLAKPSKGGFKHPTVVCLEQQRTLDKKRVMRIVGRVSRETLNEIEVADLISKGITPEGIEGYRKYARM